MQPQTQSTRVSDAISLATTTTRVSNGISLQQLPPQNKYDWMHMKRDEEVKSTKKKHLSAARRQCVVVVTVIVRRTAWFGTTAIDGTHVLLLVEHQYDIIAQILANLWARQCAQISVLLWLQACCCCCLLCACARGRAIVAINASMLRSHTRVHWHTLL